MRKLKEDLSHTLHNFVDTVVQDVVAKVASNYRDTLTKHKSTANQLLEPKIEPKAPSSDESVISVKHQPSVVPTPTPTIASTGGQIGSMAPAVPGQVSRAQQIQDQFMNLISIKFLTQNEHIFTSLPIFYIKLHV